MLRDGADEAQIHIDLQHVRRFLFRQQKRTAMQT
jgi:hypothetical protein